MPDCWAHGTEEEQSARRERLQKAWEEMDRIEAEMRPAVIPDGVDPVGEWLFEHVRT